MKEGSIDAVISSPPYSPEALGHRRRGSGEKREATGKYKQGYTQGKIIAGDYGSSDSNLGNLPEGSFDICVSSPPYEEGIGHGCSVNASEKYKWRLDLERKYTNQFSRESMSHVTGDTFWSASREIVQQCYELLKPNGKAIWVTKDYVKAKKRVPFSDRWLALCESVGFKLVCRHQALLTKVHGAQICIDGECQEISTERKSFFRRLAESKGSPRIDWEDVLCLTK
jgi:hypothetical protein